MQLTDIITPQTIKVPLAGADKHAVIDELLELLAEHGRVTDLEAVKQSVWQREATRTTGIGHGLAIPHGKSAGVDKLVMAIGKPATPIEYGSIDGKPVGLIFLLASPPDQTTPHIQALARVSRLMMRPDVRAAMMNAPSASTIYELIVREESAVPVQ